MFRHDPPERVDVPPLVEGPVAGGGIPPTSIEDTMGTAPASIEVVERQELAGRGLEAEELLQDPALDAHEDSQKSAEPGCVVVKGVWGPSCIIV